jgi:hypothetical protein
MPNGNEKSAKTSILSRERTKAIAWDYQPIPAREVSQRLGTKPTNGLNHPARHSITDHFLNASGLFPGRNITDIRPELQAQKGHLMQTEHLDNESTLCQIGTTHMLDQHHQDLYAANVSQRQAEQGKSPSMRVTHINLTACFALSCYLVWNGRSGRHHGTHLTIDGNPRHRATKTEIYHLNSTRSAVSHLLWSSM